MKIRNGFVSNSSSSSFIIILLESDYKELLKKVDKYQKEVLDELEPEHKEMFGKKVVVIMGTSGNNSSFERMNIEFDEDIDDDKFYEKFGYERYAGEAFSAIKWPESAYHFGVDC